MMCCWSRRNEIKIYFYRVKQTPILHEIATSSNSRIRQFKVPYQFDLKGPETDYPGGKWASASPEALLDYSAVACFFALEIHERYDVPVGIINASMGGSHAEVWMSSKALKPFPEYRAEAEKFSDEDFVDSLSFSEQKARKSWYRELNIKDLGLQSEPGWKSPDVDISDWKKMVVHFVISQLPEKMRNTNGLMPGSKVKESSLIIRMQSMLLKCVMPGPTIPGVPTFAIQPDYRLPRSAPADQAVI